MGIRNLAYCVADVVPKDLQRSKTLVSKPEFEMNIAAWRRLDVGEENTRIASSSSTATEVPEDDEDKDDPYTPSALSKTAHSLVSQMFLPYKPDIIIIERQRWRSASSAAIQQWTVRVNMLEGMLWAILTAFRDQTSSLPSETQESMHKYRILGVDPKRVGNFWISQEMRDDIPNSRKEIGAPQRGHHIALDSAINDESVESPNDNRKLGRGKMEKRAKIQLLRSWLTDVLPSTSNATYPAITFKFSTDAERTRAALCSTSSARGKSKAKSADSKKMDDVTDCFLQAAAWVAWEGNRLDMLNHDWDSEIDCLRADEEVEKDIKTKKGRKRTTVSLKSTKKTA
jgi:cruciform cutting endonuclease 1